MNPEQTANEQARDAALAAVADDQGTATGLIEYRSRGRVLIIGQGDHPDAAAYQLPKPLSAQLLRLDEDAVEDELTVPQAGRRISMEGHLGAFTIYLGDQGQPGYQTLTADLVLDLGTPPRFSMPIKPAGYIHCSTEPEAMEAATRQLGTLTGTFEKPRFFEYRADMCAYSRSGQPGCRRCIDACPTEAIRGLIETVEVDAHRCQGGGICTTVCPTGAMGYA